MRLCVRGQDIGWMSVAVCEDGAVLKSSRLPVRPEGFLRGLLAVLKTWRIDLSELTDIALVDGPGSFTALRTSLSIGNTLAFSLAIPVTSIHAHADEADDVVWKRLLRARMKRTGWVIPHYGGEAHITKAKGRSARIRRNARV